MLRLCCILPCLFAGVATGSIAMVDSVAVDRPESAHDAAAPDYTALLSVKPVGTLHVEQKKSVTIGQDDQARLPKLNTAERDTVPGILFVKMIKVAGELYSSTLAQYALKQGWRTLQHKGCDETTNPLGQATCECPYHYIGPDELPAQPNKEQRYAALYTHMHYKPDVLTNYMVPGTVKLVILRHPLSVLRSTHAMAAYQAVHQPQIRNSFCQDLAHDGDAWRAKCEMVRTGMDSLLDYLDHDANEKLKRLFEKPDEMLHMEATAIVDKATLLLEDFYIGLQEDFDASMLLFEQALKWSRDDSLYVKHDSANSHHYHGDEHKKALDSWGIGTPRGDQIVEELRRGPYFYHELLYNRGVAIHEKQMQSLLGSKENVDSAVETYRIQLTKFTTCMHKRTPGWNVCRHRGLVSYAKARPHCARVAGAMKQSEA